LPEEGSGIGGFGVAVVGVIKHNHDVIRCGEWVIDL
jgi:hypothetical protein